MHGQNQLQNDNTDKHEKRSDQHETDSGTAPVGSNVSRSDQGDTNTLT